MAKVHIRLPAALSDRAAGARSVSVDAASVPDALDQLGARHPDLGRLVFDAAGRLRPFVHVFVEDRQVGADLAEPLGEGDEIRIVPSLAGG